MRFVSCAFARVTLALIFASAAAAGIRVPRAAASAAQALEVASALASSAAPAGLRTVWHDGADDPAATLDRLERAGFHVAVALPPHIYYVRETASAGAALPVGFTFRSDAAVSARATGPKPGAAPAALAAPDADADAFDLFQGRADALPPITPSAALRSRGPARAGNLHGLPFGAKWVDTSEFMIGRVAVSILFPESDGTTDPNRYDWTPALRDSVVRSAVRGLARWSVFAARRGVPLSFALEVHPGLATGYEPIDRTVSEEDSWIQDVLTGYLGYKSDAGTLAYDAANGVRSRLGAQWGVLLFAVQDDSSSTGQFPDGLASHARLGGPYFVTPVKNAGAALGGATLDDYIEHEVAHMFWALDEHIPSTGWWSCNLSTGYMSVLNSNSYVPGDNYCGSRVHCLMRGIYPDDICVFTEGQIGWADKSGNGVPDLLETRTAVFPDSDQYRAVAGSPITLRGKALEIALPNQNPYRFFAGDTISAATIDSVVYRIDNGPSIRATSVDGAFDSGREYFTATIPPLPPGDYVVEWEAWNSNGLPSATNPTTTLSLRASSSPAGVGDGKPPAGKFALRYGPTPSGGPIRFALRGKPGSAGWGTLHDVRGRVVARWRLVLSSSGSTSWIWNGRVAGGAALPSGLYFLSIEIDGAVLKRRLVISH